MENELDEFVMEYFDADDGILNKIIDELRNIYMDLPYRRYFEKGIAAFTREDHMTEALYLFPLFDFRTSELVRPEGHKHTERYSDKGYEGKRKNVYDGNAFL